MIIVASQSPAQVMSMAMAWMIWPLTSPALETEVPLLSFFAPPLITKPPVGLLASAMAHVNGDGLDDLIVGAYQADPNGDNSGKSYVVFGKTNSSAVDLTKPPVGLLASAMALRLMALLLALPNTT
jgi:hypothetical protein